MLALTKKSCPMITSSSTVSSRPIFFSESVSARERVSTIFAQVRLTGSNVHLLLWTCSGLSRYLQLKKTQQQLLLTLE